MFRYSILRPLLLLPFWASSACQAPSYRYQPPIRPAAALRAPAQLVFLTFHLRRPPDSSQQVTLVRTQRVPGTAKPALSHPTGTTYLRVSQLDAQQRPLLEQLLAHPLQKEIEYLTPAGALTRRLVTVAEADFVVRMPLHAATTTLQVEEIRAAHPVLLATFPFPAP